MSKITIYTDGSARGNPGKAGWGVIILFNHNLPSEKIIEFGGRSDHATNNQMELTATIESLKYLKNCEVEQKEALQKEIINMFCDSKYVINGILYWIKNWQQNNWRTAANKPVLNRELWEELHELTEGIKIDWKYVPSHTGHKWNERADEIATSFADGIKIFGGPTPPNPGEQLK